jgi:hypothetical protein
MLCNYVINTIFNLKNLIYIFLKNVKNGDGRLNCVSCSNFEIVYNSIRPIWVIQGVSEISTLILTGNRTHQK